MCLRFRDFSRSSLLSLRKRPNSDEDRTADLPVDEQFKFALGWAKKKPNRAYSVGFTFIDLGDGKMDQTSQGVRFRGKFDDNYVIFLSGSITR